MTAAVLTLTGVPAGPAVLNLCDRPTITAVCASLTGPAGRESTCGGPLAYQSGGWHHVILPGGHRWCDAPQPQLCEHGQCGQPADVAVPCAHGREACDGCCWEPNGWQRWA